MASLTRIKSLLDFPLKSFPQLKGRNDDLYELRAQCTRGDGYFLLKTDPGDHFESSFPLMLENTGAYMLGRIVASQAKHFPDRTYYDVYIHGGSLEASCFCTTPQELAGVLRELEARGMEYVFTDNETWGVGNDDRPFDEIFVEFPTDIRFAIMFGDSGDSVEDDQNKSLKRLEEYFE